MSEAQLFGDGMLESESEVTRRGHHGVMRCKTGGESKGEENETGMDGVGIGEYGSSECDRLQV